MALDLSMTICDTCAMDHVVRFTRPFPSAFAYRKRSKTGAGKDLGTRLANGTSQCYYTIVSGYIITTGQVGVTTGKYKTPQIVPG